MSNIQDWQLVLQAVLMALWQRKGKEPEAERQLLAPQPV